MLYNQITQPLTEPVVLADVQGQCRIGDLSAESSTINMFIAAMRQQCESITRRALITQEWEIVLDAFPLLREKIEIPLPPLQTVNSIKYVDGNGILQTLDPATYDVVIQKGEKCQPGYVKPVYGSVWPVARNDEAVVTINFTCGYGPIAPATDNNVPQAIKQWILINVANLYENRETIQVGQRINLVDVSTICDGLIYDFRIHKL